MVLMMSQFLGVRQVELNGPCMRKFSTAKP